MTLRGGFCNVGYKRHSGALCIETATVKCDVLAFDLRDAFFVQASKFELQLTELFKCILHSSKELSAIGVLLEPPVCFF